jgi:predicted PurR-regulated permease PerM
MSRPDYARIAVLIVFAVVLYFVFRILEPFLPALVWAAILASVFYPLFTSLSRRLRHPRVASGLTCLFVTVVILLPALFLFLMLAKESVVAYKAVEEHLAGGGPASFDALQKTSTYQWFLAKSQSLGMPQPDVGAVVTKGVGLLSGFLVSRSAKIFSGITHSIINFFVMIFALYYLFLRGRTMLRELRQLSFLRPEHEDRIIQQFRAIALATFGGSLATAVIHGTADGIIFLIFGLPSPLLWGAVMAFLSLIPLVGTGLVWVPLAVYYILKGSVLTAVLLVVAFGAVAGVVDNIVKPLLIRRGTEIDSLWVLLSVLGGIGVFGLLGLFLGPFLVALLLVLIEIYKVEFRDQLGGNITPA